MSDTREVRKPLSLKERRIAVLRRTGRSEKSRLLLGKPPAEFYWVLVIVASFVMLGLIMVLSSSSVTSLHTGSSAWGMFFVSLHGWRSDLLQCGWRIERPMECGLSHDS